MKRIPLIPTIVVALAALFIVSSVYHMWLGMQVIIEDYVHDEVPKFATLMANTSFWPVTW